MGRNLAAIRTLARRSIVSRLRHPTSLIPDILTPLVLIAVFAASFDHTSELAGFPAASSFLDFGLVGTIVIGVFFSASDVGEAMAVDVECGFFDRLLLAPVARTAILAGTLLSTAVLACAESLLFIIILAAFGANIEGGAAAVLVVAVVMTVMAVGMGALTTSVGLRSGTAGSFGGYIPVAFVLTFISSAYFPRTLMHGWYRFAATINPVSWLVEDLRHQVTVGFDAPRATRALAMVATLAVVAAASAARALDRRATQ